MKARQDAIDEFFNKYPAAVAIMARGLRDMVRAAVPDAREELDRPGRVVGYSYGEGYSGLVCTIILSKTGVKLGIVGGAQFPDPAGLLEGSGKQHRYVEFGETSDLERPGILDLLDTAATRWKQRKRGKDEG
jgi:hypothetical protein